MSATDPSASPLDQHVSPVGARAQSSGRSTGALICGILAVLTTVLLLPGLILGVIALVLGLTSRSDCKRKSRPAPWQATAGAALGGLAVLGIAAIFVAAAVS
jgi:hypothetical protein